MHTIHLVTTEYLRIDNYVNIKTETSCHCKTVYPEKSTAQMLAI